MNNPTPEPVSVEDLIGLLDRNIEQSAGGSGLSLMDMIRIKDTLTAQQKQIEELKKQSLNKSWSPFYQWLEENAIQKKEASNSVLELSTPTYRGPMPPRMTIEERDKLVGDPEKLISMEDIFDQLTALQKELEGHRNKWGGPTISGHPAMMEQVRQNNDLFKQLTAYKESVNKIKKIIEENLPSDSADHYNALRDIKEAIEEFKKEK